MGSGIVVGGTVAVDGNADGGPPQDLPNSGGCEAGLGPPEEGINISYSGCGGGSVVEGSLVTSRAGATSQKGKVSTDIIIGGNG